MAKITSIFQPKGAIGDTVFRKHGDKTIAYLIGPYDKERWLANPKGERSRENAQEFGGAAKAASAIYNALRTDGNRNSFRPYAHNFIAKRLRKHAPEVPGERAAHSYTLSAALPALHRLDLSHEGAASRHIRLTTLGPNHNPDAVRIQGLRQAADAVDAPGNARLEFRISRIIIDFPEIRFDPDNREWNRLRLGHLRRAWQTTPWIPIECVEKEGITVPLSNPIVKATQPDQMNKVDSPASGQAPSGQGQATFDDALTFLFVEWQLLRPRRKPKLLPGHAMIRLAAIHRSPEHALEMALLGIQTPKRTKRYRKLPPATPTVRFKHRNPAQHLRAALKSLDFSPPGE